VTLTNPENGNPVVVGSIVTSYPVKPKKTTVYTLTACNAASQCVSANVTVTVKFIPTIGAFTADPPEILLGQSSTLSWSVANADRVTLTNGAGGRAVPVALVGNLRVTPTKTTVYTLTACSAAGECVSASVTVTVKSLPRIRSFTANPSVIAPYQISRLSWEVENADRVTLTNVTPPDVRLIGYVDVRPSITTVYTLTACKAAGECVSAHVTVTVYAPPYITFLTASQTEIRKGECTLLTWQGENASKVMLYATTGEASDVTGLSSKTVCPLQTTSYYLVACNSLGQCATSNPVTITVR
jgi:hypothetical protein